MFKSAFTGILLISCLFLLNNQKVYSEEKRPNIIFIFADDMGTYDLSSYGATEVNTTQIKKWAEEGVFNTDSFSAVTNYILLQQSLLNGSYLEKGDSIDIKKGNVLEEHIDLTFSSIGDIQLKLDLYKPKNSDEPLPAVVCIHGGGWYKGNKKGFGKVAKALANNGFVAVTIDYRLSGVAPFPAQIQDCKAAVRWLRLNADNYGIDTSRIGAIGHSAGGHLVALLATSNGCAEIGGGEANKTISSRINAAVAMGAQTDFLSERTKEVSSDPGRGQIWRQFMGGTQAEKPELYRLASPLYHLDERDPSIAFIAGEFDDVSTHAEKFRVEAEKMGVISQFAIIKDAPHFFIPDSEWFDLSMDWSISFLRENLK